MIPVWQSARPCAERRPRRKTPKHSSAAPVIGAAVMFARIPGADIGTTFGLAVSSKPESRKVVLRWLHPMLVGRSDEPTNHGSPSPIIHLYHFLKNGSKRSKKFKINFSKVEAIRPFFMLSKRILLNTVFGKSEIL